MSCVTNEGIVKRAPRPDMYILETKDSFVKLSYWKAKVILWLRIDFLWGTVYGTDDSGLMKLLVRVGELERKICTEEREKVFISLSKLSSLLYRVHKKSDILLDIRERTRDVANTCFRERSQATRSKTQQVCNKQFGKLLAYQFLEGIESNRTGVAQRCKEICVGVEKCSPNEAQDILTTFFKKVLKKEGTNALESMRDSYVQIWQKKELFSDVEQAFYSFLCVSKNSSPEDVADWFKKELEKISNTDSPYISEIVHHLIGTMRRFLAPWKFRVVLQSYGVFVSQSCKSDLVSEFESLARIIKTSFTPEETVFVMDGFIERKGGLYCRAIAHRLSSEEKVGEALVAYAEKARDLFGVAAEKIVQEVTEGILGRKDNQRVLLRESIARLFIEKYIKTKEYSVLVPFIGCSIIVTKPIAPRAVSRSFNDGLIRRTNSQDYIFSKLAGKKNLFGMLSVQEGSVLDPIEEKIMDSLVQDEGFCTFYGERLASKIIEKSRISKEGLYQESILKNANERRKKINKKNVMRFEKIIAAMDRVLLADPLLAADDLLSHPHLWINPRSFSILKEKLQESSLEFCPAAEKIAENFIEAFLKKCAEEKLVHKEKPSLLFIYNNVPLFSEAYAAAISVLGLQAEGKSVFSQLLHKAKGAEEILSWLKKSEKYYTNTLEEQVSFTFSNVSPTGALPIGNISPEESMLVQNWVPFFQDVEAVEKSIFRSGASSIMMQGSPLKLEKTPSNWLVGSCHVADRLLKLVQGETNPSHMQAIGTLLTAICMEYNLGSVVPNVLWGFRQHISPDDAPIFVLPTLDANSGSGKVFSFGYENGYFFGEREYCYTRLQDMMPADCSLVKTKIRISHEQPHKLMVTYSSSVAPLSETCC